MSIELEAPTVYWPYGKAGYTPRQVKVAEHLIVLRPGLLVVLEPPKGNQ